MIWKRKYQWVSTWPGEEREDWVAYHDGLSIGRVFLDNSSPRAGGYWWTGNCSSWWEFVFPIPNSGWKPEAWQAAKQVEDWYDEGLARSEPRPPIVAKRIADLKERGKKFGW